MPEVAEIGVLIIWSLNQHSVLGITPDEIPRVVVNEPVGVQEGLVLEEANPVIQNPVLVKPIQGVNLVGVGLLVGNDDDLAMFPELVNGFLYLWKCRRTSEEAKTVPYEKPLGRTNPGLFLNPGEREFHIELLYIVPVDVVVELLVVKGHHIVKQGPKHLVTVNGKCGDAVKSFVSFHYASFL